MQLISSQKELSLTQASIAAKNREKRMLQLTVQDLASVPKEEPVRMYEGVGKMYVPYFSALALVVYNRRGGTAWCWYEINRWAQSSRFPSTYLNWYIGSSCNLDRR
jgi:hypothetical protein